MKVSAIVPTYNRPQALLLCLRSLLLQSRLPDEVLVADDGSRSDTLEAIEGFRAGERPPFAIKHIWQEDDGFRKPRILNETVRNASGDYLVFIDGDCMAQRHFIRSHLQAAEPRAILGGKRVEIGQDLTACLLKEQTPITNLSFRLLLNAMMHKSRKVEEAVRIPSDWLRRVAGRDRITDDGIWGCNFSLSRELFYEINGCDEAFLDGSIEDNDLGIRVLNAGGKVKSVRSLAIVFHLWHPTTWSFTNEKYLHNRRILEQRIALKEARCRDGIVKAGGDR
jgi:GT2 family glycosyltransferase